MNMVWHDNPRKQLVFQTVVMPEIFLDQIRNARITQMAFAATSVKVRFNLALFFLVIFQRKKRFPLSPSCGRQSIRQPVGDELPAPRRVKVRKLFGDIPAFETLRGIFGSRRLSTRPLCLNELF